MPSVQVQLPRGPATAASSFACPHELAFWPMPLPLQTFMRRPPHRNVLDDPSWTEILQVQ